MLRRKFSITFNVLNHRKEKSDKVGHLHRRLQDVPDHDDAILQRRKLPRGPEGLVQDLRDSG